MKVNAKSWRNIRLKFLKNSPLIYGANEAGESDNPEDPRFIRITDIKPDGSLRDDTFKSLPLALARPYLLKDGDILFARSGATVGKAFIYKKDWGPACFAGYLIRFSADKNRAVPEYIYYFTQSKIYQDYINESSIQATIQNVSAEKYANLPVAIPSVNEQKSIVEYLDRQTAKLDQLIEKKKRLIDLLQEKIQALITQAVTQGLDPNVPMKDSGIEWLGKVPAHWRIEKLKYHVYLNPETLSENTDPEQELLYIEIGNVSSYGEISDATYYLFKNAPSRARRKVRSGDVIISTVRTYLKAITYIKDAPGNLVVSTGFAVLRAKDQLLNSFLGMYVRNEGFINEIVARSVGVSYPAINASELIELGVVIPPIEEQRAIVDWLNSRLSNVDKIITNIEKQINLIKEYRQALITAAVTGKINVREKLAVSANTIPAGKE
jgi:type I restriction enzyme S subunit